MNILHRLLHRYAPWICPYCGHLWGAAMILIAINVNAATYCVGPSATGSGSGADWNNLKAWTASPVRGDIWYLTTGTYAGKTLNTANSGTTLITIKKATVADHVTSTGWSDSMAVQASIGTLTIGSSYWTIDGVSGDGASVMPADITTSHYGFYITPNSHPVALTGTASFITFAHCRFFTSISGGTGIYQADAVQGTKSNLTITRCLFDGFNEMIRNGADTWNNTVLEYSVILRSQGDSSNHGNAINSMYQPLANMTIRYNVFKDMSGNGISGMISGNNSSIGPLFVYGNVFDNIPHCTYIIGANSGYSINNSTFYNNTVIHCDNDDSGFAICGRTTGSGNVGANNLLYDCISVLYNSAWSGDYDAFYSCSLSSGTHKYTATGNPFVNYAGMDYRLAVNTPAGNSLSSTYNTDSLGNTRSTWTRGAFEFGGTPSTNPIISVTPASLTFPLIKSGTTSNLTLTVINVGSGTLAGTASVSSPFSIASGANYSMPVGSNHIVTVTYSPTDQGPSSGTVTFTGGGGSTVPVTGSAYTNQTGFLWWATNALVTSPMSIASDIVISTADSSSAVTTPGYAFFGFNAPSNGYYYFQASARGTNGTSDSFFFNVDAASTYPSNTWDILPATTGSNSFAWRTVGNRGNGTFDVPDYPTNITYLTSGDHFAILNYREQFAAISNLLLTAYVTNSGTVPTFITQPENLRIILNGSSTNEVLTAGTLPIDYQWWKDSSTINGATQSQLPLNNVQTSDAGSYFCVAHNSLGYTTSSIATVTIITPPTITVQPTNTFFVYGQTITNYSAGSLGANSSYTYVWWERDGFPINNTPDFLMTLTNANSDYAGQYTMHILNEAGAAASDPATVRFMNGLLARGTVLRVANLYKQ